MAITLKNITAADTISSMVDKINFNFDQLLLNGGGIEGPRGIEGYPGMQGVQGEKGNTGLRGEKGERGVHFHLLNRYGSDESAIEYALEHGLDETDPEGDEYKDGDMIIALIPVSSNGDANFTDSIWRVEERQDNFYPVNTNVIFSQTTFFEEIIVGQTNNKLLRTRYDDSNNKRGLVLNDYNHRIIDGSGSETATITDSMIEDIIDNNIVLVYTEALSQNNSEGSPNCGIVFYKNTPIISGTTPPEIGDFPRINYIISPNSVTDHINYFNIAAPQQGLHLTAKNDILVNSIEGNITIKATDASSKISIERSNKKIIVSKKEGGINELHLIGDEIFIEKENVSTEQWLKIRNKNYTDSDSCEIELCKNGTYISFENLFSIGYPGLETKDGSPSEDEYFNQSRILLTNGVNAPHIDIISPEIYIGRDPRWDEYADNYGISILKNEIKETAQNTFEEEDTNGQYSYLDKVKIALDTQTGHKSNVLLETTYPGVTKISNVSEKYLDCIINYVESDDFYTYNHDDPYYGYHVTDSYNLGTSPMMDGIIKNGRYNRANMNCYQNMSIRNINNMGAVHAGSLVFTGRYGGTNDKIQDKLAYDFIRVGNVVYCTFHGEINTNKICARNSSTPNITKQDLYKHWGDTSQQSMNRTYGESFFKSNVNLLVNWPTSNSISSRLPNYMSLSKESNIFDTDLFSVNTSTNGLSKKSSYQASKVVLPTLLTVSLNRLYLNLYPPVIKVTKSGNTFSTNISDFNGHMVYSSGGSIYHKELVYYDDVENTSSNLLKIPAITVKDMTNSTSASKLTDSDSSGIFTLAGSTSTNIVEISGYFSYVLNCKSDNLHSNKSGLVLGSEATIVDVKTYTSGRSVYVPQNTIIDTPVSADYTPERTEVVSTIDFNEN